MKGHAGKCSFDGTAGAALGCTMKNHLLLSCLVLASSVAVGCAASSSDSSASSEAASTAGCVIGTNVVVTDGPLRLRPTPDTTQMELAWLPTGTTVAVTAAPGGPVVRGNWVHVTYGGQSGWVNGGYLSCQSGGGNAPAGPGGGAYDIALIQTDAESVQVSHFENLPSIFPGARVNVVTFDGGHGNFAVDGSGGQPAFDRNLEALASYYDGLSGADARPIVLALSGHSVGDGFWGSGVTIGHDGFQALAARHSRFSSRVAMVYMLACNAGRRVYIEGAWKPAFPSAWLFGGFNNVGPTGGSGGDAFFVTTFARAAGASPATIGDPGTFARGLLGAGTYGGFTQPSMYSAIEVYEGMAGTYASRAATLGSNAAWDRAFNDQLPPPGAAGPQVHLVTEFYRYMNASDDAHANVPSDTHNVNTNALRIRYNVIQDYKDALRAEGHTSIGADVDVAMYQSISLCLFSELAGEWLANAANVALLQSSSIAIAQIPHPSPANQATFRRDLKGFVDRLGTGSAGALALHDMVYLNKTGASVDDNVTYLKTLLTTTVGAGDL